MQRLASPEMHQFFLSFEMDKITSSNSVHYIYIYIPDTIMVIGRPLRHIYRLHIM